MIASKIRMAEGSLTMLAPSQEALVSLASVKPRRGAFLSRDAGSPEFRVRPEQESCPQLYRGSRKGQEAAATRSLGFAGYRGNREAELAA
jgi:hypothetical protein